MRRAVCLAAAVTAIWSMGAGANAGPVFDDYLNYPVVDQRCPADNERDDGLVLATHGQATAVELKKEQPIGQTIQLGPDADKLWTISVGLSRDSGWDEGEEVTFTLWDSPAKKQKLCSRTLDAKRRWHKWDVPYNVYMPTTPGSTYYFELTHNGGGDDLISVIAVDRDDYKNGQAYVGGKPQSGKDLYFQILTKPRRPREENLRRFLDQFDFSRPELAAAKSAYDSGGLDQACTEILRMFEAHLRKADWISYPKPDTKVDTTSMDYVCDENKLYNDTDQKDEWIEMGPQTNWHEAWMGTSSYVRQNDLFAELGWDYYKTKNDKYARKLNDMMLDYMGDNTAPYDGGMWGAKWNTMGVGWRLGDAWDGIARALDSPALTDDVKLAWLDYNCRMARQVELGKSGGNQANSVADSMMLFAQRFPFFARSKVWFEKGFDLMVNNSLDLFRDDGGCKEPAMNYHGFSLATMMSGIETAKGFEMTIPSELNAKLEKALAYTAYMLMPNGQIPSYGDTDIAEFRPNVKLWDGWRGGEAMEAYDLFGREDCLYIATAGKQGKRPELASTAFPLTGHYIMRSDWGGANGSGFEDARWLLLRGGKFGSHGHWDLNEVTLYAYGRPLLIDPGRSDYGTPLMFELTDPQSHNVLLVDRQKMQRRDPVCSAWHTTPVMDFVCNSYTDLYPGVSHRRAIVFVRPGYYVMFDAATGSEPHKMGINFWLTPPEVTIDAERGSVHSNEPNGSNVLLQLADTKGVEMAERKGTVDYDRKTHSDMPVVTFWQDGASQVHWTTVMYPYPKGVSAPDISVSESRFGSCLVQTPESVDAVFCANDEGTAISGPKGAITGRAGVIRFDNQGSVKSFSVIEGSSVTTTGRTLAKADSNVDELSVVYGPNAVEVTCPTPDRSLQIASLGRKKAVVNGETVSVSGDMFRAF